MEKIKKGTKLFTIVQSDECLAEQWLFPTKIEAEDKIAEELEKELNTYEQLVNGEMSCYGVRDIFYLNSIYREIQKRNYIIRQAGYKLEKR